MDGRVPVVGLIISISVREKVYFVVQISTFAVEVHKVLGPGTIVQLQKNSNQKLQNCRDDLELF